ncbi:flagellar motor switch protein FliM [Pelagicoccus sp. NFK12]|uniref:Flagellar motor switch protein FliM n=1 Tax=Pelagicoccus enzymogenes TaxID=2773457 RepID=A0A927F6B8_9BACT|nr:flagellar motor switch protein FliM [Pelagicoccus enzymogenes]MBD5778669.1 flagellar motor switch protein FliM [Pelagicoccus enzymogenes]MDQ8196959.1 flagellar motor switch protein FliM [Pelagicoccus enzymogenes]
MADDDQNEGELLNQTDIDALIQEAMEEPEEIIYDPEGNKVKTPKGTRIEPYDFRNPIFLTEVELRRVRIRHEEFIRYLAARLSIFLRLEYSLKMSRLSTLTYSKFTETIPNPAHVVLFKIEQLFGVGVIDINPRLALTMVDRMLGGKGHSVQGERYLTEIETNLVDDVVSIVLEEWCRQWKSEQELDTTIIGHESNGRFLETSPADAIMLVLSMEAGVGDCSETIQIGLPYYTLEPIIKRMHEAKEKDLGLDLAQSESAWQASFNQIDIPVQAEWDGDSLTTKEVLNLRPGDVIRFPKSVLKNTRVRLSNTIKFTGEIGLENNRVGVKLNKKVEEELPEE